MRKCREAATRRRVLFVLIALTLIFILVFYSNAPTRHRVNSESECASPRKYNSSAREVCKQISRHQHRGLVDYVQWDGDPELKQLIEPLFRQKQLVVWHLDIHTGPIADIRALVEPLGVEFVEHTEVYAAKCIPPACVCSRSGKLSPANNVVVPIPKMHQLEAVLRDPLTADDIARADAFLITCATPLVESYLRYNRSIIIAEAIRYDYTLYFDAVRWHELNERIRAIYPHRRHVVGANSLYDVEYMHYFSGVRPDFIPSFCAYTGAHWQPVRKSFLYARRPRVHRVGSFWSEQFEREYYAIRATFTIEPLMDVYSCGYFFSDLAQHLGIVHLPYQVGTMSFFEQYAMGIPLFAPSLDFLTQLHIKYWFICDRTYRGKRTHTSPIEQHAAYNGSARVRVSDARDRYISLDPHDDFDERAVRHWLSLADYYAVPHVVLFESVEHLVNILQMMWQTPSLLHSIHEAMRSTNRSRLKSLLRYWRRRLRDIAEFSPNRPE